MPYSVAYLYTNTMCIKWKFYLCQAITKQLMYIIMISWPLSFDKLKSVNTMHPSFIHSYKQSVKLTNIMITWFNKFVAFWMVDLYQHLLVMIILLSSTHVVCTLSYGTWFTPHIPIERESGKLILNEELEFGHFSSSCDNLNGTKCTQFMYFCTWKNLCTYHDIWIVKLSLGKHNEMKQFFLMRFLFISSKKMMWSH